MKRLRHETSTVPSASRACSTTPLGGITTTLIGTTDDSDGPGDVCGEVGGGDSVDAGLGELGPQKQPTIPATRDQAGRGVTEHVERDSVVEPDRFVTNGEVPFDVTAQLLEVATIQDATGLMPGKGDAPVPSTSRA